MADKIKFPKTMKEFIDSYSFKDEEQIYTNGAELIPVFRVEQALEHYEKAIRNKAINDFAELLKGKAEEILKNPDIMADCKKCTIWKVRDIEEIAEQLKGE